MISLDRFQRLTHSASQNARVVMVIVLRLLRSRRLHYGVRFSVAQGLGILMVALLGHSSYRIGPIDLDLSLGLARRGWTTVRIPPLGRLSAQTHRSPVELTIMPEQIHVRSVSDVLTRLKDQKQVLSDVEMDARAAARSFMIRLAVVAFLGGAVGSLIVGHRGWRDWLPAGGACVLLMGLLAWYTRLTYNPKAFQSPEYTGVLTEAPKAIEMMKRGLANVDRLRNQLRWSATNLAELYAVLEMDRERPSTGLRILHVSDIHNNPAAVDFISGLARSYNVRLILATGDITDFGTAVETLVIRQWKQIRLPTFFIGGNHDSRETLNLLAGLPRARVFAEGQVIQFKGLAISGWNDPISRRHGLGSVYPSEEETTRQESEIRRWVRSRDEPPDILMVHNHRLAASLAGLSPVIVFGHDHRPHVEQRKGTMLIDAGTTGASGVDYFTVAEPPPYSAAILHYSDTPRPRLIAVDLVQVREPSGEFTVTRTTASP